MPSVRFERSLLLAVISACLWLAPLIVKGQEFHPSFDAATRVAGPASVAELARALKNDPFEIVAWVYDNIEYELSFGIGRGPVATILDGRGNDMEQSALVVALLRQAGFSASYQFGTIKFSSDAPFSFASWLGVDPNLNGCTALNIFLRAQIAVAATFQDGTQTDPTKACAASNPNGSPIKTISMIHVWVTLTLPNPGGSTTFIFDPSVKIYNNLTGVNLASAMGYSRATFLSAVEAGYTLDGNSPPNFVQKLNRSNLRNTLTGYAQNLIAYIQQNDPVSSLEGITSGRTIQHQFSADDSFPIPFNPATYFTGSTQYTAIPNSWRKTLNVQLPGINATFFADAIYGHRFSVTFQQSGSSFRALLELDGAVQATGSFFSGSAVSLNMTVADVIGGVYSGSSTLNPANGTYLIMNGWGMTGRGMVDYHRKLLNQNRLTSTDTSEVVVGESLSVAAYTYSSEHAAYRLLRDNVAGTRSIMLCDVGVVAINAAGVHFDIPLEVGNSGTASATSAGQHAFIESGYFGSALEHGAIEQTVPSTGAVSTVQLLDFAAQSTDRIFSATSANYQSTVLPIIQNNYGAADLSVIQSAITAGNRVILPEHGRMTPGPAGSWIGGGWIAFDDGVESRVGWIISGGSHGGDSFQPVPTPTFNAFQADPAYTQAIGVGLLQGSHIDSLEPIDMATGDYLYDHTDLSVGSASFPYGLAVERSYNSARSFMQGSMGLGWSHKFDASAHVISDSWRGLGSESPIDAAAAIVATYISYDVLNNSAVPASMPVDLIVIDALVNKWLMDQLTANAVSVQQPGLGLQFTKLADGSYNPPLGSADTLSLVDGAFNLRMKDGTTLIFNNTFDISGKTLGGNLVSWQNPAGAVVTLAYTGSGTSQTLNKVSNNLGRQLNFTYSGNRISSVNDNNGRTVSYGYDGSGNLTTVTDPAGQVTTFGYGGLGQLTQVFYPSFPSVPFVTNTYDSLGRVMTQANANNTSGNNTTYQYFFAGARSEELDPYGNSHVMYNNPRGKVVLDLDQDEFATSYGYDAQDRLISKYSPERSLALFTYYDASTSACPNPTSARTNNICQVTLTPKQNSGLVPITQTFTYDPTYNKVVTATDGNGNVTTNQIDPATGNLLSVTRPADVNGHHPVTSFTYNTVGQVVTSTDPTGVVTTYSYDPSGTEALVKVIRDSASGGLNLTTQFGYDAVGNQTSVTDPRGNVTTTTYDVLRRPTFVTSPYASIFTRITYDPDGRVIEVLKPTGNATTPFQKTAFGYSPSGQKWAMKDPNGNLTSYAYDLMDRLKSVTDAAGHVTSMSYDARGKLYQVTDALGHVRETHLYTPNGKEASFSDVRGNVTSYTYDGFDRLAETGYADGTTDGATDLFTSFDANGNLLSRTTRKGDVIKFTYDALNRVTAKTSPAGNVSYGYDLAGRTLSVSGLSTVSGLPTVAPPVSPGVRYTNFYFYDPLNRLYGVNWGGANPGAASTNVVESSSYTYSNLNQRKTQTVGDVTLLGKPQGSANQVTNIGYGTANNVNQVPSFGSATLGYDADGNLKSDGTNTYSYDAENRLLAVSGPGLTASYAYDGLGRRLAKTVNGVSTVYVSAGDQEVVEYAGNTAGGQNAQQLLRHYVYANGIDEPLDMMTPSTVASPANDTHAYTIPDIQGSILALLNPALSSSGIGALTDIYGYRPFGESAQATGAFRYTARRFDAETGLYYDRARMYSPALGRFLQPDPIGLNGGLNLYAYVGNDPLNNTDPTGLYAYAGNIGGGCGEGAATGPKGGGGGGGCGGGGGGGSGSGGVQVACLPLCAPALPFALGALGDAAMFVGSAGLAGLLGGIVYNEATKPPTEAPAAPPTPQDILAPGGQPIGTPNAGNPNVRNLPGGLPAAEELFGKLGQGGTPNTPQGYPGTGVTLPDGGFVGLRPKSTSGPPAIDVNIPGLDLEKLHFPP